MDNLLIQTAEHIQVRHYKWNKYMHEEAIAMGGIDLDLPDYCYYSDYQFEPFSIESAKDLHRKYNLNLVRANLVCKYNISGVTRLAGYCFSFERHYGIHFFGDLIEKGDVFYLDRIHKVNFKKGAEIQMTIPKWLLSELEDDWYIISSTNAGSAR